jgi:hypothetical protein
MTWRELTKADLMTCLEMQTACIGDSLVGRQVAVRVWRELLSSPSFLGMVIESERPIAGHNIVACGLGVFVSARFADEEIANPRPGLNSRVIAGCAAGDGVVLTYEQLGLGNAGDGLDFVNMYGTWREKVLNAQDLLEVRILMGTSFVESHAGYRLNRVLKEAIGEPWIRSAQATAIWRVLAEFPETGSALLKVISREKATQDPYSTAAAIYQYRKPVLGFRECDQQLLIAALKGATDTELAVTLDVSLPAVKKRWLAIFSRLEEVKPELLALSSLQTPADLRRGPQKRHRALAYVRVHPEELRPYAKQEKRISKAKGTGI